jgi:hypothetical protein
MIPYEGQTVPYEGQTVPYDGPDYSAPTAADAPTTFGVPDPGPADAE